jgi:phosphatidylserine/phosphatidylglycerophosphate/cardiolipin synthase-like enzyme
MTTGMPITQWYLTRRERGNPATRLDARHSGGLAWTEGNLVRPLVHGATYFAELYERVSEMVQGDLLMFADWRGDPDERLTADPRSEIGEVLAAAAARGVDVRGLVWRSHWDRFAFSAEENRHLGEEVNAAGGQVLLDMRVRLGGSHHQKFVILRHREQPERDIAFLGGIDLCHGRKDDHTHKGDRQRQKMAAVYGERPPWHDVQLAITGPAVGDVETVFRERWEDPHPLSRSPMRWISDRFRKDQPDGTPLPPQSRDPEPVGPHPVQILRTYPRRAGGYAFAPLGERSVARGYIKAVSQARHLIYIEDQYLWSPEVSAMFAAALCRNRELRLIAVLPHFPDQDGAISKPPNLVGRERAIETLRKAAPGRVAFYWLESPESVPVYVHAKVCVIDDQWASVGSDNFNRRSWTHDSELSAAVYEPEYARSLRLNVAGEHLGLPAADQDDRRELFDPAVTFARFADSAAALQKWHDGGCQGSRPPGQLRPLGDSHLTRFTRAWATPLYRLVYDPDGRPVKLRIRRSF